MATAQQQQPKQQATTNGSPPAKSVLEQVLEKACEYTPFMGREPIKLSASLVMSHLCKPTKNGKICTQQDAVRFIMLCQARGLNPWEGDAFIIGYDSKDGPEFNLVTAHQAFLKRAEVHPEYQGMESGVTVRDGAGVIHDIPGDYVDDGLQLVGGWAKVHFKTRPIPMYRRLKLATFHKGRSRWNTDAAGMIVKCAEADALRSSFPNSLGGMYLADEMPDRSDREPVAMPRAIEPIDNLPKGAVEADDRHETLPPEDDAQPAADEQPAPERNSIEDEAASNEADERLSALQAQLLRTGKANKSHQAELKTLYGKSWVQMSPDEQTKEIRRLEGLASA